MSVARVLKDQCGYGPNTEETHKDYSHRRCGVRPASDYPGLAYRSDDIVVRTLILVVRFSFVWKTRSNKGLTPGGTRRFLILLPTSEFIANSLSVPQLREGGSVTWDLCLLGGVAPPVSCIYDVLITVFFLFINAIGWTIPSVGSEYDTYPLRNRMDSSALYVITKGTKFQRFYWRTESDGRITLPRLLTNVALSSGRPTEPYVALDTYQ